MIRHLAMTSVLLSIASLALSCRQRNRHDEFSLAAKNYQANDEDILFTYERHGEKVELSVCTAKEWKESKGDCPLRRLDMSYIILRKLLIDELKASAKETDLKQKYHTSQYEKLSRKKLEKDSEGFIRAAFHLQERDYYRGKKEQTKRELEMLLDFESLVEPGFTHVLTPSHSTRFAETPLAEKLRTIFFREKLIFRSPDNLTWRFQGNDVTFFGAERLCEKFFPGYRMPNSDEASSAVHQGLSDMSFGFAVKQHYPRHTGVRTFWTSDLPGSDKITNQFSKVTHISKRAWAQNFDVGDTKGQLVFMNFRSSLFCVK